MFTPRRKYPPRRAAPRLASSSCAMRQLLVAMIVVLASTAVRPEEPARTTPLAGLAGWQLALLEKLNRADLAHLARLPELVVPAEWHDDELRYTPFPPAY